MRNYTPFNQKIQDYQIICASFWLGWCVCLGRSWLQAPPAGSTLMAGRWVWQWKAWSILSAMCLKLPKHMSSCSWRRFCLRTPVKALSRCDSKPFTHLLLLQDTFFRYLKSPVYKDIQKKALNPAPHNFRLVIKSVYIFFPKQPCCEHYRNHVKLPWLWIYLMTWSLCK